MASSTMTGERRWVSARRGGMTVLGKIAVPKPVNLPSQRSENHGLDPNVDIVPKGTISWGPANRSTSANSWSSLVVSSPNAEGTASAPVRPSSGGSHLTGRPSSGGSGTRPSTAGSEKSCELGHSAWSTSRPSSASGVLPGNNTIAAARPRSADTRPGSSQLSRFADSSAEGSIAWRGPGTSESLGTGASKASGFTLSSGDFPTLGCEKVPELLHGQQGNNSLGRPSSASDRPSSQKASPSEESKDALADKGTVNTWKRDHSPYRVGGDSAPDKWQRESQHTTPYANMHMPPQHFDAWYSGPIPNQPEGGWFRGAAPVGPYAPMGVPGGYPLDPSTYYHSQMAVRSVPYPPTMPRPGAAGTGFSKNGEVHRSLIPDSYMIPSHPLIPVRPGMYPGPVPGYYGPSPGFCKSDETDAPIMGIGVTPSTHDARYPNQSTQPDLGSANARFPASSGPNMETSREHSGRAQETQGSYKVLLKQRDEVVEKDAEDKKNHHLKVSSQHSGRPTSEASSVGENDWDSVASINEPMDFSKPAFSDDSFVTSKDNAAVITHPHEGTKHVIKDKFVAEASSSHNHPFPVSTMDRKSVGQTDNINVKPGAFHKHSEVQSSFSKEDNSGKLKVVTTKRDYPSRDVSANVTSSKGPAVSHDKPIDASFWVKSSDLFGSLKVGKEPPKMESSTSEVFDSSEISEKARFQNYKRNHGGNTRGDHRPKGKFHIQEGDGWRRKILEPKTSDLLMEANTTTSEILKDNRVSQGFSEKLCGTVTKVGEPFPNVKASELYITSSNDSIDYKTQRAKMKEIAVQRAKQRQEEEEERIREQKAKALAKLEELNKRTASECSTQNGDETSRENNIPKHKIAEQPSDHGSVKADLKPTVKVQVCQEGKLDKSPVICNVLDTKQEGQISVDHAITLDSTVYASKDVGSDTVNSASPGPQTVCTSSVMTSTRIGSVELPLNKDAMQPQENDMLRQRPVGAKKRPNLSYDRSASSHPSVNGSTSDAQVTVVADEGASRSLANVIDSNIEHTTFHKRKSNKALKNKHKLDEASITGLTTSEMVDISTSKATSEIKPELTQALQEVRSAPSLTENNIREDLEPKSMSNEFHASDESHARTNNWRNQSTRRPSRSSQMGRQGERLHGSEAVWAPVRPTNQSLLSEDTNQQNIGSNGGESANKSVHGNTQTTFKSKRAEMERYVPKPVVKELSQQGTLQQPSGSSSPQTASSQQIPKVPLHDGEKGHQNDVTAGKAGAGIEMRTGEGRHKHGKAHTSWRQRGVVESYRPSPSCGENITSDQGRISSKAADMQNFSNPQASSATESAQFSGGSGDASVLNNLGSGSGSSHDLNVVAMPGESSSNISKDGKKKPQTKLQVGADNNEKSEEKVVQNNPPEKNDRHSSAFKSTEIEGRGGSGADPHSVSEHRAPQWQPKTHFFHKGNRAGGRGMSNQKFTAQTASAQGKEVPSQGIGYFPQHVDKYHGSQTKSQFVEKDYISQTKPNQARVFTDAHNQEKDREIKVPVAHDLAPSAGRGQQQTARQIMPDQSAIVSEATREQPVRAGSRRHGQQSSGFHNRPLEETRDDNWSQGEDRNMQQHRVPSHSEKKKPSEYQRGDSHGHGSSFQHNPAEIEVTRDICSPAPVGSKYRERGNNQGRRGGRFYGRAPNHIAKVAAVGDGE